MLFCTTMFDHAMTGSGRFAQSVPALSESEHEISVSVLSEDVENNPGLQRYKVKLSTSPAQWFTAYRNKSRDYSNAIEALQKSQHFDLIFFNEAWLGYHWLKSRNTIPVVTSVRDDNAMQFQQGSIAAIPGLAIRRKMERSACRLSSRIITNSDFMATALTLEYALDRAKVHVLHPVYTDYTKIDGTILPISEKGLVNVLFIKHDDRRGGLDLLIKALIVLPQYQFVLTIIGPDADVIAKKYARIGKYVHLKLDVLGHEYDQSKVLALMKVHHIFCVPSLREAFGVANIEALASGMRVVYHAVGGIPEALRNFGFLMNNRTIEDCRQSILEAIQMDQEQVAQRLAVGQKWIQDVFSTQRMTTQLANTLRDAIRPSTQPTSKPKSRTA